MYDAIFGAIVMLSITNHIPCGHHGVLHYWTSLDGVENIQYPTLISGSRDHHMNT